jgi:hypothetical protein
MQLYSEKTNAVMPTPGDYEDFRGDIWTVYEIAENSTPGKSGKVQAWRVGNPADTRYLYPGVFGAYIASEPRS